VATHYHFVWPPPTVVMDDGCEISSESSDEFQLLEDDNQLRLDFIESVKQLGACGTVLTRKQRKEADRLCVLGQDQLQ